MSRLKQAKGFTIIEVVLVLAIAGLIFLMVFIALPALQRSQRDAARKNEVGTVASAITNYMTDNRSAIPTGPQIASYITGNDTDELESGVQIIRRSERFTANINLTADVLSGSPSTSDNTLYSDQIKVYFGYKCNPDDNSALIRGTSKQSAIAVALENGPSRGSIYCQTN